MSPVPGGMSTTRQSSAPHSVPRSICSTALITMGPRHTAATSTSMRKPMDMQVRPYAWMPRRRPSGAEGEQREGGRKRQSQEAKSNCYVPR